MDNARLCFTAVLTIVLATGISQTAPAADDGAPSSADTILLSIDDDLIEQEVMLQPPCGNNGCGGIPPFARLPHWVRLLMEFFFG